MSEETQERQSNETIQIINRLLRKPNPNDKIGATSIYEMLEISPIPLDAVIPICNSVTKAAITDYRRKKLGIPLAYIWLETYLLANKGAKKFAFHMLKEVAQEQAASEVHEAEIGEEGE